MKRNKLTPVWALVLIDFVLFAAMLLSFCYFHHVRAFRGIGGDESVSAIEVFTKPPRTTRERTTPSVTTGIITTDPTPTEPVSTESDSTPAVSSSTPTTGGSQPVTGVTSTPVTTPKTTSKPTTKPVTSAKPKTTAVTTRFVPVTTPVSTYDPSLPYDDSGDFGATLPRVFAPEGVVEKTANSYRSHDVYATLSCYSEYGTEIYVQDIYVRNIDNIYTAYSNKQRYFSSYIKENEPIGALSGDLWTYNAKICVRNGELLKKSGTPEKDVLVLYWDGTMEVYTPSPSTYGGQKYNWNEISAKGPYQIWNFGPQLVLDGQPLTKFNSGVTPANPRAAIGYFEPGHYCFVSVYGRGPNLAGKRTEGIKMSELSKFMANLGCTLAFNLDGGGTAQYQFLDKYMYMCYEDGKGRGLTDVICFGEVN